MVARQCDCLVLRRVDPPSGLDWVGSVRTVSGIEAKFGGSPYTPLQQLKDAWLQLVQKYPVDVVRYSE